MLQIIRGLVQDLLWTGKASYKIMLTGSGEAILVPPWCGMHVRTFFLGL